MKLRLIFSRTLWLAAWLAAGATITARAHDPGLSVATARLGAGTVAIHLAMARTDAEQIVRLDADHDGQVTEAEFQAARPELERQGARSFAVTVQGKVLTPERVSVQRDNQDGVHFDLTFSGVTGGELTIRSVWIRELARGHRQYLSLQNESQHVIGEKMLDAGHDAMTLPLAAPVETAVVQHSFKEFLSLGVEHIATGYDHQLFLLGLLLVGGTWRSALKIITSFTVAHSITLALTALNVIHLPSKFVEPMIAASIVYVGLENLLRRKMENRWMLTFCFGLIHGCGFASALQDLGVGANGTPILVPLVSFNLGVEAGQLVIASLVLPVIWKCQASPAFARRWVPAGSAVVVLLGGYWLAQRTIL
ncbi:MAG: HupE/UreJ family protein [Verrucomicrobiae bacterium]|nr:HupE/UreJ family protein [Verrucomicrobiae bacterium]